MYNSLSLILIIFMFSFNLISDNISLMNNDYFVESYPPNCAGGLYGIGSDYQQKVKAYVYQYECPWGFYDYNIPEEGSLKAMILFIKMNNV